MSTEQPPGVFQDFLNNWQSIIYHPVVASFTGALGAAFYAFPGATIGIKAMNGIACFFVGIYAGPAIVEWRGVVSAKISAAIIIACALGGLIIVNSCLDYLRKTKIAEMPFLRGFLGANQPPPTGEQP